MGLFSYTFTGGTLILLGTWESFISTSKPKPNTPTFSTISVLTTLTLSILITLNSTLSLLTPSFSHDPTSLPLNLQTLSITLLFTLFALLAILKTPLPSPFLNLLLLFAFVEEFLLFYLHLGTPSTSVEARFYDLMLVPILVTVLSTVIDIYHHGSSAPAKFGRGVGLIMQGAWFVQMGFSFFTSFIPNNCNLVVKSRGNYGIKCKGHMDTHRGGAIGVLLFNCHLAVLVAVIVGVYAVVGRKVVGGKDYGRYTPLRDVSVESRVVGDERFSLDSDEDESGEIKVDGRGEVKGENGGNGGAVELAVNGFGLHR